MRLKDENKRQAIIEAAVDVFARDGFHTAKMHRIADRAGIAAGTVYLYFESKDAILVRIFESVWEKLHSLLKSIHEEKTGNFPAKLNTVIDSIFDFFIADSSLAAVFASEENRRSARHFLRIARLQEKTMILMEDIAEEGIREGYFDRSISPKIFSAFILGGFRLLLNQWAQAPKEYPLDAIRTTIKKTLLPRREAYYKIS